MHKAGFLFAALIAGAATPAGAMQAEPSVDTYLCQFAGKCGSETEDAATRPAPATRGFRLAAPQGSNAAPSNARTAPVQPTRATAPQRASRTTAPRRAPTVVASRPPAAGARANLMLNFDYNSDRLTPTGEAKARTFAQALQMPELRDKRFRIEGHTDARGARAVNLDLSRRRAQSVANFLQSQGVESGRIEVRGVGPDQPLPGQSAGASANRRVEAVLLS